MDKDILINEIRTIFDGIVLEDGIGLWEAQGLDDYADEETLLKLKQKDERINWDNLSYKDLAYCASSLSFFDAKGMLFHLPKFLIFDILEDKILKNDGYCVPDIVFTLSHELDGEYQQSRFSLFNYQQIICIIHFLEYKLEELIIKHQKYSSLYGSNNYSISADPFYIEVNETLAWWKAKAENYSK